VAVANTVARKLESVMLGTISPLLHPQVKITEDDLWDPEPGSAAGSCSWGYAAARGCTRR
jgi:hypothetical protein